MMDINQVSNAPGKLTDEEYRTRQKLIRDPVRRIVAAANKVKYIDRDGNIQIVVIVGARHFDNLMHAQYNAIFSCGHDRKVNDLGEDQGFVDQFGDFHTREEAFVIAERQNQLIRDESWNRSTSNPPVLYSENLY